jgi:uncharacterized phage protein (TIGR02218 family)
MSPVLDDVEIGVEDAEPLDFYRVTIGNRLFLMTNAKDATTFQGQVFQPTAIERTSAKVSSEESDAAVEFTIPQDHALAQLFYGILPGQKGLVDIRRTHKSIVTGTSYEFAFRGYLSNVRYEGNSRATFRCDQPTAFLNRNGPRFMYTSLCNNVLYDARCTLNPELFKLSGTVTALPQEDTITVPGASSMGADYFDGGYVYYLSPGGDDYRVILKQTGNDIRILIPFMDNVLGQSVSLYAGCRHTVAICDSKFANKANFGGFPFVPFKNPFQTRIL